MTSRLMHCLLADDSQRKIFHLLASIWQTSKGSEVEISIKPNKSFRLASPPGRIMNGELHMATTPQQIISQKNYTIHRDDSGVKLTTRKSSIDSALTEIRSSDPTLWST
jgi:hypothetical protein